MMNAQFNFELLQALLLAGEIINIGVGQIVCFAEHRVPITGYDLLGQVVQLFIRVTEIPPIQNMIIVSPTIKADQLVVKQLADFFGFRIDHSDAFRSIAIKFPVDQKQIGKHFNIVEHKAFVFVFSFGRSARFKILGLKMHLADQLDARIRLICGTGGESKYPRSHVANIVVQI